MWNVFKKVWVKGKGVKAVLSDACNIGHVDEGDVTNGERTLFPQRFPWRSSLRMRGSSVNNSLFMRDVQNQKKRHHFSWILVSSTRMTWTWLSAIAGKTVSFTRDARNTKHAGQWRIASGNKLSQTLTQSQMSSLRKRGSRANNTASFVGDIFPNKRALSQCRYDSALGRSMIEMLGVLAIIGVLSIAAVAGYRFALLKFRANEVTNELNMRAINVSAQMLNTGTVYEKNELIEDGFGDTLTVGFPVETAISDRNTDYFEILVSDIPADLCRQILRDYENPIMIFVNNVRYNADTTICDDETQNALNDMGFIYKNDLGTHEACSEKGYFDEEDFQCHCSGNTYLDIYTNDCLCPAGHVWSAGEGTCIESICPEGEFESLTAGCVPCSDDKTYTIATDERHKQLCEASTCGRIVVGSNCVNADVNNCIKGKSFRKDNGECVACSQGTYVYLSSTEAKNSCTQNCPTQRFLMGPWCINKDWCPDDNRHFFQFDLTQGPGLSCISCDSTWESVIWGFFTNTNENDTVSRCSKCTDAGGAFNRAVKRKNGKDYCGFRNCTATQFKGADEACYDCSHVNSVYVGTDNTLKTTCLACDNREVTEDGYCRIKDCSPGTGIRMKDGTCYPCNHYIFDTPHISLNQMEEPESCELCPGRTARDGICYNEAACPKGSGWWVNSNNDICYSCDDSVNRCSNYGCELCNLCEGRHATTANYCALDDACHDKSKFQNKTNGCIDCSYTQKVDIGAHEIERNHCLSCRTTARYWAGSYCYRCDSSETPSVTTSEEEDSCNSCAEREVKDGKCVLVQ